MVINVSTLVDVIHHAKCTVRIKLLGKQASAEWSWAIMPVLGYIELGSVGPWPIREVEWLEINPVVTEYIGRLVAPRIINNLGQIEAALCEAEVPYSVSNGIIRVPFQK